MRQTFFYGKIFLMVGGLFLTSCHKEYFQLDRLSDEMEIRTDVVAPLIHGSMYMGDIVSLFDSAGYVGEFEDGLIYLAYTDTLVEVMVDTLDLVIDGLYQEIYFAPEIGDNPIFIGSFIGDTIHFKKSKYFSFKAEGDSRVDSIVFKGGEMLTEIESTFLHSGLLTISSEYIRDTDRNLYSNTIVISDATGNYTWSESQDIDGYWHIGQRCGHIVVRNGWVVDGIDRDLHRANIRPTPTVIDRIRKTIQTAEISVRRISKRPIAIVHDGSMVWLLESLERQRVVVIIGIIAQQAGRDDHQRRVLVGEGRIINGYRKRVHPDGDSCDIRIV